MDCDFSKATGECLVHGECCDGERYPLEIRMSSTSGIVMADKEDLSSPWAITYPWGADSFHGTREEVKEEMKKQIKEAGGDYS